MAYCRFSEGDVYLYRNAIGIFVCSGCKLRDTTYLADYAAALAHLREHVAAGHRVPQEAFDELVAEQAEEKAQ